MKKGIKSIILVIAIVTIVTTLSLTTAFAGEWKKDDIGWWYQNDNGNYPISSWFNMDRQWYYFNESGYMHVGWFDDGENWYYLSESGAMQASGITPDGHFVTSTGAWVTTPSLDSISKEQVVAESPSTEKHLKNSENFNLIPDRTMTWQQMHDDIARYSHQFQEVVNRCRIMDFSAEIQSQNSLVRYEAIARDILRISYLHYGTIMKKAVAIGDYNAAIEASKEIANSELKYTEEVKILYWTIEEIRKEGVNFFEFRDFEIVSRVRFDM